MLSSRAVLLVCHHSLLSRSNETVRMHQELWGGSLAQSVVLGPLSRHPSLMGMQGENFHSAEHQGQGEPSPSWALCRGEQQEWASPQ